MQEIWSRLLERQGVPGLGHDYELSMLSRFSEGWMPGHFETVRPLLFLTQAQFRSQPSEVHTGNFLQRWFPSDIAAPSCFFLCFLSGF